MLNRSSHSHSIEIFTAHKGHNSELPSPGTEGCPVCIFCAHRCQCYVCGIAIATGLDASEGEATQERGGENYDIVVQCTCRHFT